MNSCCNTWTVVVTHSFYTFDSQILSLTNLLAMLFGEIIFTALFVLKFLSFSVRGCSPDCRLFAVKSIDHGGTLFWFYCGDWKPCKAVQKYLCDSYVKQNRSSHFTCKKDISNKQTHGLWLIYFGIYWRKFNTIKVKLFFFLI